MVLLLDKTPDHPATAVPLTTGRQTLAGLDRARLKAALAAAGVPERQLRMRVNQLWSWMYVRGVTSFDAMTDVAKDVRRDLAAAYSLDRPEIVAEQVSVDGTRKVVVAAQKTRPRSTCAGGGGGLHPRE